MRLDPIVIVPYDPDWIASFARQRAVVETALGAALVRPVDHIGSTAVPGLPAKPIIDMLAVTSNVDEFPLGALEPYGWIHAPEPDDVEQRRLSYCLPSVEERTHHLHVVEESFAAWPGWMAFRDYLRAHPDSAEEYAALKSALADAHGHDPNDRAAYRAGKSEWVQSITSRAVSELDRHP